MINIQQRLSSIIRDIGFARLRQLIISSEHPPYLTRHRAETIASRIRIVAGAFSLLTVAWIALDRLVLPWPSWGWLAGLRLFASLVFIVLAVAAHRGVTLKRALSLLGVLLALPLALFLAAQFSLSGLPLNDAAAIDARLYAALPIIIVAGLGVMPLTVAEGLAYALRQPAVPKPSWWSRTTTTCAGWQSASSESLDITRWRRRTALRRWSS